MFAASDLSAARALMADSLGFHIIFALLGVGLPLVISLTELWGIRRRDTNLMEAARRLSLVSIVLVVAGVVSGTILAIQMPLMWPGLVEFGAKIVGLPFMFEGYAFLLEAIFLAFYVATWKKIKGYKHWLLSIPVVLGSLGSAFFITTVNSWMQNPQGFERVNSNGELINPNVWSGILTKTTFFMTTHSILGYYAATFLLVAGGYTWYLWRKKPVKEEKATAEFLVKRFCLAAVITSLVVGGLGHFNLQYLAKSQPHKFAAIELVPQSTDKAPYVVGGELSEDGDKVEGGVKIPYLLSVLATNNPSGKVPGLNETPKKDWPMLVVHRLFEMKMILVGLMISIPLAYLVTTRFSKRSALLKRVSRSRIMMALIVLSGPIAIMVIELGWMVTEFGRQPYIVRGYLLVEDAFSKNPGVLQWGYIFPALYVLLFIATAFGLRKVFKHFTIKEGSK